MTALLGFDLNGLWDFVAEQERDSVMHLKDLGIHGSLVRLEMDPNRWVGGQQAALAPHGKGDGWGQIGAKGNRIFLEKILGSLADGAPTGEHATAFESFLKTLAADAVEAVITVPDTPSFDEAARDRYLRLLQRAPRLRVTLLWRPVATLLGWLDEPTECRGFQPAHGMRIAVLSLMDKGIHLADATLVQESWNGSEIWVPERDKAGAELGGAFAGEVLARQTARHFAGALGVGEDVVLTTVNAPWRIAVGEKPGFELIRLANRSWRKLSGVTAPIVAIEPVDQNDMVRTRLAAADALLIEGPMARHEAWVDAVLVAVGWPPGRPVHRAGKGLAAKGGLKAALRTQVGAPVYYDFLPQLEINALVNGEPRFVELIPRNQRLLGGTIYRGDAPGDFAIDREATRLTFYLFKEDLPKGRKAEVDLPERALSQHRIRVSVEQSPGQGFARVRIESESFEALRRQPLELDWSRMEVVEETREQILAALAGQSGLAYPDAVSTPGHPFLWHPRHPYGNLLGQLQAYINLPLLRGAHVETRANEALKTLRVRFSRPDTPSYRAQRMGLVCNDRGSFRALDSNGVMPSPSGEFVVPEAAEHLLDATVSKAGADFDQAFARPRQRADPKVVEDIVGFATWCFWRCPPSIVDFLLDVYEGRRGFQINQTLLREGIGRAVHQHSQLERYFAVVGARLTAGGSITAAELAALGRVLAVCPDAAELLPIDTADRILKETCAQLAFENHRPRAAAYKRKFKTGLLMLAALLRHRRVRPDFLDPDVGVAAQGLLEILKEALDRNWNFCLAKVREANHANGATSASHRAAANRFNNNGVILSDLVDFIHKKGLDPNIIRRIDNLDDVD